MRILFLTGRETGYPRNRLLLRILQKNHQVEVVRAQDAHAPALGRSLAVTLSALPLLRKQSYDLVVIGFFGHLIVPVARRLTSSPILFDAFVSTYDTLINDRQTHSQRSLVSWLARRLDRLACDSADQILLDTQASIQFFATALGVSTDRLSRMWVGCEEDLFYPQPEPESGITSVLFYGSFQPLHGIDTILNAANLLREEKSIRFSIIGQGRQQGAMVKLAQEKNLTQVTFGPPIPYLDLPRLIAGSTICLGGPFGNSEKARRVITGKTYQCIAMGKATIVGDSPANHELLSHQSDAWFCEMDNAGALAEAIGVLHRQPELRERLGRHARATFMEHASLAALTPRLEAVIQTTARGK